MGIVAALIAAACGGTAQPSTPGGAATAAPTAAAQTAAPTAAPTSNLGTESRPIVMAFVPSQDTQRITTSGKAIAASLEKATSLKWDVKVPTSYAATIEGMCAGQIDVAWLATLAYVLANQKNCADIMLASLRKDAVTGKLSTTYESQIVVRADSGIKSLKDLKGKKMAYSDPISTSGYLFPVNEIKKLGEDPKTFFSQTIFAGGHDKAILAVYQGQVDAAASFIDARDALEKSFPDIKQKTTRIATAGPIPNDTVSVRKNFPADLRTKIETALLAYAKSEDGVKALKSLYSIDGLEKAEHKTYEPIVEVAKIVGLNLEAEAAKTARPVATPAPSPTSKP